MIEGLMVLLAVFTWTLVIIRFKDSGSHLYFYNKRKPLKKRQDVRDTQVYWISNTHHHD